MILSQVGSPLSLPSLTAPSESWFAKEHITERLEILTCLFWSYESAKDKLKAAFLSCWRYRENSHMKPCAYKLVLIRLGAFRHRKRSSFKGSAGEKPVASKLHELQHTFTTARKSCLLLIPVTVKDGRISRSRG